MKATTKLRKQIAATERLLSLYDSPFPDAWERAKRAELIATINGLNEQLAQLLIEPAEEKKQDL